jgi:folate-binding protein YgfZ
VSRIADQYRTVAEGAGWIVRSGRGWLRVEGRDAVGFLHALVTNDVHQLKRGEGVYAAYLTPQGRMVADLTLYHRGEALLAAVAPGVAGDLAARLDASVFSEDVRITDVSSEFTELLVTGGAAALIAAETLGVEPRALEGLAELAQHDTAEGFVARAGDSVLPAFTIVASAGARVDLVERLERAGARPMTDELAEALRIAAGRPAFGIDMTTDTIPLEAGLLERGISTGKGCYVGQEIIVRILHRGAGRVARRLVTLHWASDGDHTSLPSPGTVLHSDGRAVGQLTSAAPALSGDGGIGLGYVVRDLAVQGGRVALGESGPEAEITGFAA